GATPAQAECGPSLPATTPPYGGQCISIGRILMRLRLRDRVGVVVFGCGVAGGGASRCALWVRYRWGRRSEMRAMGGGVARGGASRCALWGAVSGGEAQRGAPYGRRRGGGRTGVRALESRSC